MTLYFFYAFLATATLNFICSILILRGMTAAGIKVSFFEIRWQVHKHLKNYRKISLERTGKVAWPYYGYQASLAGMIGFAILTLLTLGQ
ncbi:MAG: hypothetical protein JRC99_01370 [Deltaproteobacteria bacterium]|nr:hypothetical protein [Deltaproteobacteria bacterium]RLB63227.1 MAG: hypothetical protein DRH08_11355 [Deltaproteobacteria bacterium]